MITLNYITSLLFKHASLSQLFLKTKLIYRRGVIPYKYKLTNTNYYYYIFIEANPNS